LTKKRHCKTLVVVAGPTAVGKTSLSIALAGKLGAEIISADARQFYRELRIGTARPTAEELATIPHHFVAHLSVHDYYNVSLFEQQALSVLDEAFKRADFAIITGGSGLYIDTLCYGIDALPDADQEIRKQLQQTYEVQGLEDLRNRLKRVDPAYYDKVDLANPNRMMRAIEVFLQTGKPLSQWQENVRRTRPFAIKRIVLNRSREELFARINERVDAMIADGLIEEAADMFRYRHLNALNTVGYKELYAWLANRCDLHTAITKIKTNTRRYAKRQLTWCRRYQDAAWFSPDEQDAILAYTQSETSC
jgi:tRNA dimethylallyltransferase